MSIIVTLDIQCDECGNWLDGNNNYTKRAVRKLAKNLKWTRYRKNGNLVDICPVCQGIEDWVTSKYKTHSRS